MNVYDDAEDYGLTQIGEIVWRDPHNGDCDMTAVWADGFGSFYYADDAGLDPFHDLEPTDLVHIGTLSVLEKHLAQRLDDEHRLCSHNTDNPRDRCEVDRTPQIAALLHQLGELGLTNTSLNPHVFTHCV